MFFCHHRQCKRQQRRDIHTLLIATHGLMARRNKTKGKKKTEEEEEDREPQPNVF